VAAKTAPKHAKSTKSQPRHAAGSEAGGQFKPNWFGRKPPPTEQVKASPPPGASTGPEAPPTLDSVYEAYEESIESRTAGQTHGSVDEVNGSISWALPDGTLHREDGPALIHKNGTEKWFRYGVLHRADGPAIRTANKSEEWHFNGVLHCEGGPAVLISPEDGDGGGWHEEYYRNGVLHRKDGPAITTSDGTQMWYREGKLRRAFGPAVIHADGRKEWCGLGRFIRATAIGLIVMKIFASRL
jgi:hypothetical protein